MQNNQKPEQHRLEGLQERELPKKNTTTYTRMTRMLVSSCTKATKSGGRHTREETNLEAKVSYCGLTRTWARAFTIPTYRPHEEEKDTTDQVVKRSYKATSAPWDSSRADLRACP